jgi:hypothetical protein
MAAGISMGEIARRTDRNKTTVQNWAEGSEPKESDARVILALYAKHCPVQYTDHAKAYEIHVEIDAATYPGETRVLPFV